MFDGWAFAVGDVLLGTNPVSSDPASVAAIERALQDLLVTFGIEDVLPHCVLAHIDVQAEVERNAARSNGTLVPEHRRQRRRQQHLRHQRREDAGLCRLRRTGHYGLYFETGQGADFTNGHATASTWCCTSLASTASPAL